MSKSKASKASPDKTPAVPKAAKGPVRHRVVESHLPKSIWTACESLSRHFRDLHNTAVHLARTAILCFEWDPEEGRSALKAEADMPAGGLAVLAAMNAAVLAQNAKRTAKANKTKAKPKLVAALDADNAKPLSTILDATLFESTVRSWPDGLDPRGRPAYRRLPSWLANHAVQAAREQFSTWVKQAKAYRARADKSGAGLPRLPGYLPRGEPPSFGMSLVHERYKNHFPPLSAELDLRLGEDKAQALSAAQAKAFEDFGLGAFVENALRLRYGQSFREFEAKEIRFVPTPKGVRLQIVVATPDVFPQGSFLSELSRRDPKGWAKNSGDQVLMQDWVKSMASTQTWHPETMATSDPHAWISQGFEALGIDPGVSNVATVASSGGARAMVFSATKIESTLAHIDAKIDAFVSAHTPQRLRDLDAKREKEKTLPLNKRIERRSLIKALHRLPELCDLRRRRDCFSKEMLHKLSRQIAGHAQRRGAAIVFLSRNKGLKTASGLGAKSERRSHRLSHSLLAQLLRHKLWESGIMLIESEESFTSQSSFADADPLPIHPQGARQSLADAERAQRRRVGAKTKDAKPRSKAEVQAESKPVPKLSALEAFQREPAKAKPQSIDETKDKQHATSKTNTIPESFSGIRGASGSQRHWLSRQGPTGVHAGQINKHRRQKIHADGNAALNAIRKVSPGFSCSARVSLGHEVWILHRNSWKAWDPLAKSRRIKKPAPDPKASHRF